MNNVDETIYCKIQNIAYLEIALQALKQVMPGDEYGVNECGHKIALKHIALTHKNLLEEACNDG